MTTDERIERLEKGLASARRFNRWLLVAGALALGVWILAGTFGPTMAAAPVGPAVDEVRAKRFVLVDNAGTVLGRFVVTPQGPELILYGAAGKMAIRMNVTPDGLPALALYDAAGRPRAGLLVTPGGPGLWLYDAAGKSQSVEMDNPRLNNIELQINDLEKRLHRLEPRPYRLP